MPELLQIEGPFILYHKETDQSWSFEDVESLFRKGIQYHLALMKYGWSYSIEFTCENRRYRRWFLSFSNFYAEEDVLGWLTYPHKEITEDWIKVENTV